MDLEPVVVEVKPPKTPFKLPFKAPKLPQFGNKSTKVIMLIASVVIIMSVLLLVVFTVLANSKSYKKTHNIVTATDEIAQNTTSKLAGDALPGGTSVTGKGGTSGTNSPVVTLTASQASVSKAGKVTLTWSATNNPKSCVASDDWSGAKGASGSEESPNLVNLQTYLFTLTCKTDTGTGFATVSVSAIEQGGTGSAGHPVITMSATPSQVYVGQSATLNWVATNSPTSCVANDDWSGAKSASGNASTGPLVVAKSYKFTLTCTNESGSGYVSATVVALNPPPDVPLVTISANPVGPIFAGSSSTITWSVTNSPSACIASLDWAGSKAASGSISTGVLNVARVYDYKLTCSNAGGETFDIVSIGVVVPPPDVSITVSPTGMFVGNSAVINWTSTNSPTSCSAGGDWTGTKAASGTNVSTGVLNTVKTYSYSIVCTNDSGQSATRTATVNVTLPPAPVVTLNASPIAITAGSSSTLTWSATNSPTSCTASGDWTGTKTSSGTASTGALNTIKTYAFTLSCTNAGGSSSASTSVGVSSGAAPVVAPVVTISTSPTSVGTGSASTISWSATNNPTSCTASGDWSGSQGGSGSTSTGVLATARIYTYTLACSNSAGTDTKSATVTAIAIPVVTISVTPASITTGASATLSWSATNTPTSCTAGGSWTGTKAASGTQTITPTPAGSYSYSLSCTNAGGTGSNSTSITVTDPVVVYCGGLTPCYGPTTLALHTSTLVTGSCWAYITGGGKTAIYNLTGFANVHSGGSAVILTVANCGNAVNWTGAPSNAKHTSAKSNTQATLNGYLVGYYDAAKP